MVHSGKLKLYRVSPDGQEKIIEIIKAGEVFAEALMFMDHPHYPVNSSALTQTDLIAIHAKTFKDMLSGSADTCIKLMGDMSFRLHQLINEIDTLTLHSGTCRVASYLLQNTPEDKERFELDIPKSVLAARLSVKPETFSRITRRLRDKGVLSIDGNTITIHNRNALKELSII
jgi:CRP-like cAMP-binding protein